MKDSIIGGVSPLKARKGKKVAGKVGKKATNVKAQRESGFTESGENKYNPTGEHNLESNTGNMRLTSSLADTLKYKDPGTKDAIDGKRDFGKTDDFEKTDTLNPETEFKTETETKTVKTDKHGEVVKDEDNACSEVYIAKHGDAKCIEYNAYREANPVDRSKRKSKTVDFKTGYYRTRKDKNAKWSDWMPTKGTKYENK